MTKMTIPELTFKCELQKDGQLAITIVSCANLTDLDSSGSHNLSDPYVMVKVGQEKKFTKTISDDLNPIFPEETSTFLFEVLYPIWMTSPEKGCFPHLFPPTPPQPI